MALRIFDCLVLSGGGAKGSYGAGAAYSLCSYYEFKKSYFESEKIERDLCFIGTSAGALNAGVLASYGPERLKSLWLSSTSNKTILGKKRFSLNQEVFKKLAQAWFKEKLGQKQPPFAVFPNANLKRLISENVDFERLKNKHLIILTTNFTRGALTAFYRSDLMDDFVEEDKKLPIKRRRLAHCEKIENNEHLISVLLASAAIPVFFPPVKIGDDHYVDGGVGNNTPTREAAYFRRFLNAQDPDIRGDVYCIQQDPPAIVSDSAQELTFGEVLKRTTDVTQYIHMQPIINAWPRINDETREHKENVQGFVAWMVSGSYEKTAVDEIVEQVHERLGTLGGAKPRLEIPLISVRPSTTIGDTLDFSPQAMKRNLRNGYEDMLKSLEKSGKIDNFEHTELSKRPLG